MSSVSSPPRSRSVVADFVTTPRDSNARPRGRRSLVPLSPVVASQIEHRPEPAAPHLHHIVGKRRNSDQQRVGQNVL